jgi:sigma-B regulation protein RsbU (phosphoserine phosphatase)
VKLFLPAGEPAVRARPAVQHVAMAAAAVWLAVIGVIHVVTGFTVPSLFSVAPLIVATVADERRTALFAGAAVALTVGTGWWQGTSDDAAYWTRIAVVCIISVMAIVVAGIRRRREERLAHMTAIAQATQLALLPPLPSQMEGITIAARYRSATREASVGGDLYEIIPTGRGVRLIIGDVRGNGLDAIRLAGQVLSAFRRTAVAVPAMEQVAREVGQAIGPHLGEEDFVTAALAQITPCGELIIVNCGHQPPLLRHRDDLRPLTDGQPGLPLGLADDYTAFTAAWSPGDRLLLYTDGLVESRDARGDFLPEDQIATAVAAPDCDQALDTLMTAVHRHTGGNAHDDIALLLLEYGAPAANGANGHPAAVPAHAAPSVPLGTGTPAPPTLAGLSRGRTGRPAPRQ